MSKKTSILGDQYQSWMLDPDALESDWYVDDIDDVLDTYKPSDVIPKSVLDEHPILWQGKGPDPSSGDGKSLHREIARWLRARTYVTLIVEIPRNDEAFARAIFETHKWKVKS